jgi:hypothetical protein
MPVVRFATVRALFDAFPTAQTDVDAEPSDAAPLVYVQSLADRGELGKAASFCAYLLPRREAVRWGCWCVRRLADKLPPDEHAALRAADVWVEDPEEPSRMAALELGMSSDYGWPSTWLALAAGWSGGNVLLNMDARAMAPPEQTAKAVRAAVLTIASRLAPSERTRGLRTCVDAAIRIAAEKEL